MIMIIDYCYSLHFLFYVIFDNQLKITFRKWVGVGGWEEDTEPYSAIFLRFVK